MCACKTLFCGVEVMVVMVAVMGSWVDQGSRAHDACMTGIVDGRHEHS